MIENSSQSVMTDRLESTKSPSLVHLNKLLEYSKQKQADLTHELEIEETVDNNFTALISPVSSNSSSTESDSNVDTTKRIHRVVLTGGPCAGKTTSINKIKNFFENIGWKVFCVPETATILLSSGILFSDLGEEKIDFQENLLKTLLQIEDSINKAARFYHQEKNQNVIIIYDRGAMDPVAYLD
ncbi:unnamed protein product, partial [Brachionus calyciflorus]